MAKQNRLIELDDVGSWSATTEEFLALIHRSTQLMRDNRPEEAKKTLEAAFETRKNDPSSQATLGLVYFKLGIYPRAAAIYKKLVQEFPKEPTLRLNLGLVYLKTGQTENAVRELETVIQLAPEYRKAEGYLGLAYERLGEYTSAKRAFERAGATHLAERMNRFLRPQSVMPQKTGSETAALQAAADSRNAEQVVSRSAEPSGKNENGLSERLAGFIAEIPLAADAPSLLRPNAELAKEPISVKELTQSAPLPEPISSEFLITPNGYLLVTVADRICSRLAGLHFLTGEQISYIPLKRRHRGRASDELLGDTDDPMFDITGAGRLGFHPSDKQFGAVSLDGEAAYIREPYLFAMSSSLRYENGRVPGEGDRLVHVNGRGTIVLRTPNEMTAIEVTLKKGLIIPSADLVGWFGRLLPRNTTSGPFDPEKKPIEVKGEGVVVFCFS